MQLPEKEKFLTTKNQLLDQVAILLGGRVAEEIVFGDISTGAQNDLERSTELARNMVCTYGMSDKLGPLTFGKKNQSLFLGTEYVEEKNYSEETAQQIDAEVKAVVESDYKRVHSFLNENRSVLDSLAARLEEKETLSGDEVKDIIKKPMAEENNKPASSQTKSR